MKKYLTKLLFVSLVIVFNYTSYAQVPQGIPYQSIIRNNNGSLVANQNVKLRFSIRDSIATGTIVYRETHSATTTAQGLANVNIGMGTPVTGNFSSINWGSNNKFIQVEADITGGTNYIDLGTTQMMSVPYAFFALKSASLENQRTTILQMGSGSSFSGNNIQSTYIGSFISDSINFIAIKGSGDNQSVNISFTDSAGNPIALFYEYFYNNGWVTCGACCGVYYHSTDMGVDQSSSISLGNPVNGCAKYAGYFVKIFPPKTKLFKMYYSIGTYNNSFSVTPVVK